MNINFNYAAAAQRYRKGDYVSALRMLNQLLDTNKEARTYALLAKTLLQFDMKSEAAAAFALAGKASRTEKDEYFRRAMLLHYECGNDDDALLMVKHLLPLIRNDAEVACVYASILLKRRDETIPRDLRKPLLESGNPAHLSLAMRLFADDPKDEDNLLTLQRVIRLLPDNLLIQLLYLIHAREFSDFAAMRKYQVAIDDEIARGNRDFIKSDSPFLNLIWCGDESLNRMASGTVNCRDVDPAFRRERQQRGQGRSGGKIRIGYLSNDFWDQHATMKLLRDVLERHDSDKFEVSLFCYTPEGLVKQSSADRSKWGKIHDVRQLTNEQTAEQIRKENIDILVDLKGHTKGSRPEVLNYAAAPVQVAWLGFPGTTTKVDLDYIIGDRFVLPDSSKPYYHEKFCRLPETYQPNDPVNRPRSTPCSRADFGLPLDAFVFASFNDNRKISAGMIEAWGTLLKNTENSVLWIYAPHPWSKANIRKEFERQHISSQRIYFADRVPYSDHINRMQLADLGLDTYPVNGHTTTSEQLWAGLPVLTLRGTNFASRVSESLLNAIDLPELVVATRAEYIETAIMLANSPPLLKGYEQRLSRGRFVKPLFNSERFCRHLECAFEMMIERARRGEEPSHLDVPACRSA